MTIINRNYRFSSPMNPDHIKISNVPSAVAFTVASNNMNYLAGNGTQLIPMSPIDIPFLKGDKFTFYLPVTPYPNITKRRHTLLFETTNVASNPPAVAVQIGYNSSSNPTVTRSLTAYPHSNIHTVYYDEQVYTGSAEGFQNGLQLDSMGVSFITGTITWINNGTSTSNLRLIGLQTTEYPLQTLNLEDPFNTTPYSGSVSTGSWYHGANITNPASFRFNDYIYSEPSASNLGSNIRALVRQVDTGRSWVRGRAGLFFWSSNHTGEANKAFHVTSSVMVDLFKDIPVQVERKYNEEQVTNATGDKQSPYYLWVRYNSTSAASGTLHFCNTTTTTSISLPNSSTPIWTYKQILGLKTDSTASGVVPVGGRDKFSIRIKKDGGSGAMQISALALIQHRPGISSSGPTTIPLDPSNFIAFGTSPWDMGFTWTDSDNESSYILERSGSDISPVTICGSDPELWVKWDRGIATGSFGVVTGWKDISGKGTDLVQIISANQPAYLTGSIYFDGTNDYLIASGSGAPQTTNFVVGMRIQPETLAGTRAYAARSATGGGYWSVQNSGELRMWLDTPGINGIAVSNSFLTASQMQALLWVYDGTATGNSNRLRCWVNGNQVSSSYYGTIPASLGSWGNIKYTVGAYNNPAQYFQGYIDEIFVHHINPDSTVISKLNQYLMNNLTGITQSWQTIDTPAANIVSSSEGGQWIAVSSRSLTPGRSYNYRLAATNIIGTSNWVYDSGSLFILSSSFSPDVIFGSQLLSWHRADSFVSLSAGKVEKWGDITSNARHFIQTSSANQPTVSMINEQPSFKFTSTSPTFLELTGSTTYGSPDAVHVIRVVAASDDPALANASSGLDQWGTSAAQTHYPFTDGNIYDATAGATRATVGNPAQPLNVLNVYSSISTNTAFSASLNGNVIYTGPSLGVAIRTTPRIGGSSTGQNFNGHLCEVLVVSASTITTYQHRMLSKYFYNRYGINVAPSGII